MEAASRLWPEHVATGFGYFDFLHARGSPRHALFYAGLFWPQFVEHEGMVFLSGTIEDASDVRRVRDAVQGFGGDLSKTEQSFNRVEIALLFGRLLGESTVEEDDALVRVIAEMWAARLRCLFPTRKYVVEVLDVDGTREATSIRFYQQRE